MNEIPTGAQEKVLWLDVEQALSLTLNHIKPVLSSEQRSAEISHIHHSLHQARIAAYPVLVPIGVVKQLEDRIFAQFGIDPDLAVPTKVIDLGDEFDDPGQYVRKTFLTVLTNIYILRETQYAHRGLFHDYSKTHRHDPSAIWHSSLSIINGQVPDYVPQPRGIIHTILERLHHGH